MAAQRFPGLRSRSEELDRPLRCCCRTSGWAMRTAPCRRVIPTPQRRWGETRRPHQCLPPSIGRWTGAGPGALAIEVECRGAGTELTGRTASSSRFTHRRLLSPEQARPTTAVFANRLAGRILGSTADSTLTIRSLELGESSVGRAVTSQSTRPAVARSSNGTFLYSWPIVSSMSARSVACNSWPEPVSRTRELSVGRAWSRCASVSAEMPSARLRGRSSRRRSSCR
jgi:hypothetical protein